MPSKDTPRRTLAAAEELNAQWARLQPLRRTTTLVVCPNCKGRGIVHDIRPRPCSWCNGDRVLEEVVELRRVER